MSHPIQSIKISDEHGTDYSDIFGDLDLDEVELIGSPTVNSIDISIPNRPASPRSNEDSPLGALIERWISSHARFSATPVSWQYLDAPDIHTIAWAEKNQVVFVNIFGYTAQGQRAYRLRAIASALGLLVEFTMA